MLSWETGLQDTRQKELKGSEIVFLGIHPVLPNDTRCFSSTELFPPQTERHLPYAGSDYLVRSALPASHPSRADSGPPVTPFPIGTGGGAWSDIWMGPS